MDHPPASSSGAAGALGILVVGLSALAYRVPHFYPIYEEYLLFLQVHPAPSGRKGVGGEGDLKVLTGLNSGSLKPWSYSA